MHYFRQSSSFLISAFLYLFTASRCMTLFASFASLAQNFQSKENSLRSINNSFPFFGGKFKICEEYPSNLLGLCTFKSFCSKLQHVRLSFSTVSNYFSMLVGLCTFKSLWSEEEYARFSFGTVPECCNKLSTDRENQKNRTLNLCLSLLFWD